MRRTLVALVALGPLGCATASPPSNESLEAAEGEGEGEGGGDGSDRDPITDDPGLPRPDGPGNGDDPGEGEGEGEEGDPAEGEGEDPVEGEGEDPAEGEGEDPAEGEGEDPAEGEGEDPAEGEGEDPAEGEGEDPPAPDPACRDFVRCQFECAPGDAACNERCWAAAHPGCRECQLGAWEGCWTRFCPGEAAAFLDCIGEEGCRERTWDPEADNCVTRACRPQLVAMLACADRQQADVDDRYDLVCQPGYDRCNGRPLCDGLVDCWWECGPFEVGCELDCWGAVSPACRACELDAFEACTAKFCPGETDRLFTCRDANQCDDYTWRPVDGSCTAESCPDESDAFFDCYDEHSDDILGAYLGGVCAPIYAACEADPVP